MSLPTPKQSLAGACSVIHDNTLYSYSSSGLQSLSLTKGAEWQTLASGVSVDGAVCAGSTPADASQAGLYIVGGTSADTSYPGLQKYTYQTGKWETIHPESLVTQSRLSHSATYINSSDTIVVYSGAQDGTTGLSSQTFTIKATAPHSVQSFESTISPPGIAPVLLPWSDSQAVMIGGDPNNARVMLFDPQNSWTDSGASLAEPAWKDGSSFKAAIITGDDNSKQLYTFDLSQSPNTANRTMLVDGAGKPVQASKPLNVRQIGKRQLSALTWPQYDASKAPTDTRSGYSIASDPSGLIVLSGGNQQSPLAVFNGKKNSWVDATQMLVSDTSSNKAPDKDSGNSDKSSNSDTSSSTGDGDDGEMSLAGWDDPVTTSSSETASVTSSASSTQKSATSSVTPTTFASITSSSPSVAATSSLDTAAAASSSAAVPAPTASDDGSLPATTILGIVLGIVFGVAILLMASLFLIRRYLRKKSHDEAGHARRASGIPMLNDEKKYPPPEIAKASGPFIPGHAHNDSSASFSSVAMMQGKTPRPGVPTQRYTQGMRSSESSEFFNREFKSAIGRPQVEKTPESEYIPRARENTPTPPPGIDEKFMNVSVPPPIHEEPARRSSGWGRYWSGGSALNLLGFGNGGNTQSRRDTTASDNSSTYSDANRITQDSATVPEPLKVEGRPAFLRVNSKSPNVSGFNADVHQGMSGQIERPFSTASSDAYTSGIRDSVRDTWEPSKAKSWGNASSTYSRGTMIIPGIATGEYHPEDVPPLDRSRYTQGSDYSWLDLGNGNEQPPMPHGPPPGYH